MNIPNNILTAIRTIEAAEGPDLMAALRHEGGITPLSFALLLEGVLPQDRKDAKGDWRRLTWEERKYWLTVASSLGRDNLAALRVVVNLMTELEKF